MHRQGDTLVYDLRTCFSCDGKAEIKEMKQCPLYNRAVNRLPNRRCPHCGASNKYSHTYLDMGRMRTCGMCDGKREMLETRTDTMAQDLLLDIPVKVFRQDRRATFNEQHIALGCMYSTIDYGRSNKATDEEIIVEVQKHFNHVQACHIVNREDQFPAFLAALVTQDGHSVRAIHEELVSA